MSIVNLKKIKEYIMDVKVASISDLQKITNSSESSVRRYIEKLEKDDFLKRGSGGVEFIEKKPTNIFDKNIYDKLPINKEMKKGIAKKAASLVDETMTIFIDSGSTTYYLFDYLPKNIHIYTNSISNVIHATRLGFTNINIFGGKVKKDTLAIVSIDSEEIMEKILFSIAFIGTNSIDLNGRLMTPDKEEGRVKKMIFRISDESYVLADYSKYGKKTFFDFTPKDKKYNLITNKKMDIKNIKQLLGE